MAKAQKNEITTKVKDGKYVIFYYCAEGEELKIPTRITISSPDHFINGQFTASYGKYYGKNSNDIKELNQWLQNQKNKYNELIRQAYDKNVNTIAHIKKHQNDERLTNDKVIVKESMTIYEAYTTFIRAKYDKPIMAIKTHSFDRYLSFSKRIEQYDDTSPLSDLSIEWVQKFCKWLSKPKSFTLQVKDEKYERDYETTKTFQQTNSTIKRGVQDLITFCKTVNKKFPTISFDIKEMEELRNSLKTNHQDHTNIVSMSLDELNAFKAIRPTLKFKWQIDTWNAYVVGALTGLRYSDIRLLSTKNIKPVVIGKRQIECIVMSMQKTDYSVTIPLNPLVKEILAFNDGAMINNIPTIQRLNINLRKMLMKMPQFQHEEEEQEYVLMKKTTVTKKRWERFTFHTSRKSFISLAVSSGASYDQIKRFVGFQDFRTINHYMNANISNENDLNVLNF